ncbi:MAG: FAD-dependent thymidylate synthase [Candidatus Pacearchaeota archaeon]
MKKELEVILIAHPKNMEQIVASAAKLCYSPSAIKDILHVNSKEAREFIKYLMKLGHESPLEHGTYTFGVEGISRACSHQLVRHRIGCSYSQQSQRYVDESSQKNTGDCFDFIVPPNISKIGREQWYTEKMQIMQGWYDEISGALKSADITGEANTEDARFLLPNATETKIIVSMNPRSLLNFFKQRLCNRAQWEIRRLAEKMYDLVLPTAPSIFQYAGPPCVYGRCREGKRSCGKSEEKKTKFLKK